MASANSTFTELVTTTLRNHRSSIKDNVSERVALLKYLKRKGQYRTEDGGLTIACPLDYAENGTYQRYSGYDVLDISESDVLSAAEYQWKQIAINVVASGRDIRINSGENQIVNLVKSRIKNATRTFMNNFSEDMYSAGSLTNQINGIQAIIADTNTNTVGGINANTWSFWQNTVFDLSANSVTISATTIENSAMLPLWLSLDRGPGDQPDLIVMDSVYYKHFEGSQTSFKRYANSESANGGFVALKYKNSDVVFDGTGSGIPASHAYFINTNYFEVVAHKDADMEVMEEVRAVNQDASVTTMIWMGNLVCSNRKLQGVIIE
jgi:hypothetical protein